MNASTLPPIHWGDWRWPLLAGLVAVALVVHPIAAFGVLLLLALQRAYPLDFRTAYLAVVSGASFINYTRGHLTKELSLLTIGIVFMIVCYTLRRGQSLIAYPRTTLTTPLLLYTGLTFINFMRGILVDNSLRYAGLELLAGLALVSAVLVANRSRPQHLRLSVVWLWITALGHCALGFYIFSILHVRTGSIYFTPVPGVIAALMLSFALRASRPRVAAMWVLAMTPLIAHQFLSFTRGYWLAFLASSLFSAVVFLWNREGRGARLRRVGFLFLLVTSGVVVAATALSLVFGIRDLGTLALDRLSSSTGTEYSWETSSNVVRLVEYAKVITEIAKAPLFGHGLGFAFVVREPLLQKLHEQWFTHQNYLLVTLKQGVLGLLLFVWMLFAGVRMGLSGLHLKDPDSVAWCAGTAAATVHLIVYCNVHFPLGEVNTTFTLAFLWGVTMALVSRSTVEFRFGDRQG
ncbi:MAG: O-antigen ligase family protein [Candidatus Eisenbacteria bacterium]